MFKNKKINIAFNSPIFNKLLESPLTDQKTRSTKEKSIFSNNY